MSGGKLIVSETSQRRRRILPATAIYLVAVTAVFAFNLVRSRAARDTVVASEKTQVSGSYANRPSVLERTHSLKTFLFTAIKNYVRGQLGRDHREAFNQKFRRQDEPSR